MAELRCLMATDGRHRPLILSCVQRARLTWQYLHTGRQASGMENVTCKPGSAGHAAQRVNWLRRGQGEASSRS